MLIWRTLIFPFSASSQGCILSVIRHMEYERKYQLCSMNTILSAEEDDNVWFMLRIIVVITDMMTKRQGKRNDGDFLHFFFFCKLIVGACYRKRRRQQETAPILRTDTPSYNELRSWRFDSVWEINNKYW
jgi:hypothetical protein